MRSSYDDMSHMICRFVNHYAETPERVQHVPPVGLKKEKGALAMPVEVLEKVAAHVDKRILLFGKNAEKLKEEAEATQLAKDLGKYALNNFGGGAWVAAAGTEQQETPFSLRPATII